MSGSRHLVCVFAIGLAALGGQAAAQPPPPPAPADGPAPAQRSRRRHPAAGSASERWLNSQDPST